MLEAVGNAGPSGRHERPAHDRALRTALRLRYQVYCIECNFLSPEDYPDGVETDEHDDSAAHFYAFDAREELVGYVRLVRPDAERLFPLHRSCELSVDPADLPPPEGCAEISRLMVRNDYRRRRGDRLSGVTAEQNNAAFSGERRHEAPQILLSLYRQMYAYSLENGIRHWFAAMERPLARSLQRMNFAFRAIGPETDYYGPVAPYLADLRELERQVGARRPDLLAWLQHPEQWFGEKTHGSDWGFCHMSDPGLG
ncbi:MAG: PEP-CTERM/exosortase system-associated acyltransferase [Burkholderiaceae bacterium]|nr:PEP-CTERM/exosortase system-associated acyltransferase [Burkholderiaceae bacterium]